MVPAAGGRRWPKIPQLESYLYGPYDIGPYEIRPLYGPDSVYDMTFKILPVISFISIFDFSLRESA